MRLSRLPSPAAGRWSRLVGCRSNVKSAVARVPMCAGRVPAFVSRVPTVGAPDALSSVGRSLALSPLSIPSTKLHTHTSDAQPNVGTFWFPARTHEATAPSHAMPWDGVAFHYNHDHRLKLRITHDLLLPLASLTTPAMVIERRWSLSSAGTTFGGFGSVLRAAKRSTVGGGGASLVMARSGWAFISHSSEWKER